MNILVSHRIFEFGYLIVGTMSALLFVQAFRTRKKLIPKVILVCAIVVMMIVGPMTGAMHPRSFARLSQVVSIRALSLNAWISESSTSDGYMVGDQIVDIILSIYGDSRVARYPELFTSPELSLPQELRSKSHYVVTYIYMTDFYGPNATRFAGLPYFQSLYTNGLLHIYWINNRVSS